MCGTQSLRHLKTFTKVTSPLGSCEVIRVGSTPTTRTNVSRRAARNGGSPFLLIIQLIISLEVLKC